MPLRLNYPRLSMSRRTAKAIRAFLDRAEAYGRAGGDYELLKLEERDSFRQEEAIGEVSRDPMMPGIGRRVMGGINPDDGERRHGDKGQADHSRTTEE